MSHGPPIRISTLVASKEAAAPADPPRFRRASMNLGASSAFVAVRSS